MFNNFTKRLLQGVLLFGFISISIPIRSYENLVGFSPDFSLLVYFFGIVLGFATMIAAFSMDTREPKETAPAVLRKSSITILVAALMIVAGIAVFLGNFLLGYIPEKVGFSVIAYMAGLVIGFAAIGILYYLPQYLPHEEPRDEE